MPAYRRHRFNLLVLNYGWAFIEKPFVPTKLVEMINVVLHTHDSSQGNRQYDQIKDVGTPPSKDAETKGENQ